MPISICKETLGAWFSFGIHASLSRPGLADLMVRGNISLARGMHCCPNFLVLLPVHQLYIAKNEYNDLKSHFETESSSSYYHIFFLIAFLEGTGF